MKTSSPSSVFRAGGTWTDRIGSESFDLMASRGYHNDLMSGYMLNYESPGSPSYGLWLTFPLLVFLALLFPPWLLFIPVILLLILSCLFKTAFPALAGAVSFPFAALSLRGPPLTS